MSATATVFVIIILTCVALSLSAMGIFYVIRRQRIRRRRDQRRDQNQLEVWQHKREYLIESDISNGRELNRLPALSFISGDKAPLDFHYVTEFVQCEPDIHIDTRLTNLNCCTCTGDCSQSDCQCQASNQCGQLYDSMGRLSTAYNLEAPELIRECNNACKCNRRACKNMVIQGGCKALLALVRTKSRGWGVITLENLKRGTFIGVYSGELVSVLSSQSRQDDTYLFNLSSNPNATMLHQPATKRREEAEQNKVEHVVVEPTADHGEQAELLPEAVEEEAQGSDAGECKQTAEEEEVQEQGEVAEEKQMSEEIGGALVDEQSLVATIPSDDGSGEEVEEASSTHNLETREHVQANIERQELYAAQRLAMASNFVCDAKFYGNFTRFINHSCDPNVTGIRSFTFHQDDRFPYISFFTNRDLPAGAELTLNYGDSYWLVKCKRDKVYCLCKTEKCKFNKKTFAKTLNQYNEKLKQQKQANTTNEGSTN